MGRQPIPLKQIALHAGVSEATVDRVLHDRGGVRATTDARVRRAIVQLEAQQAAFALGGRSFTIDLIMHAPHRFTSAVWTAFESTLPKLRPAEFTVRPQVAERIETEALVEVLRAIARRGSDAVILKGPDVPVVVDAINELTDRGIPVITMVTDVPTSARVAYVGIDNRAAGATAAYLVDRLLPHDLADAHVLLTMSSHRFRGEEERESGFRTTARELKVDWTTVELPETEGLNATIRSQLDGALRGGTIDAVYSAGGGNTAILDALHERGQRPRVFIAHDLDADNRRLLDSGEVSAVLHHDLGADALQACHLVLQAHGAIPGRPTTSPAPVQIITPYNVPANALHAL